MHRHWMYSAGLCKAMASIMLRGFLLSVHLPKRIRNDIVGMPVFPSDVIGINCNGDDMSSDRVYLLWSNRIHVVAAVGCKASLEISCVISLL